MLTCSKCLNRNPLLFKRCRSCGELLQKKHVLPKQSPTINNRILNLVRIQDGVNKIAEFINSVSEELVPFHYKRRFCYLLLLKSIYGDMKSDNFVRAILDGVADDADVEEMIDYLQDGDDLNTIADALSQVINIEIVKQEPPIFQIIPLEKMPADDYCSICLSEWEDGICVSLPCGHLFHKQCIERWLKDYTTCPIGRCPVLEVNNILEHI